MTRRERIDERWQVSPRTPAGRRRRSGPHLGAMRITPTRVTLFLALVGGTAFLVYAVVVRDQLQVPLMASGFAVLGLVFAALAVTGVANVVRAGREGRDGAAVVNAIGGGIAAITSLLLLAAAVIFAMILGSAR
jgi:hypothetical protein